MSVELEPAPGVPTSRQSQKAATRQRVLDAARELFDTEGYDKTTIRKIAERAEVSVGSVFTSFSSKGDVLSEVMQARLGDLYAACAGLEGRAQGTIADRLKAVFAASFVFEAARVNLFLAHIAATYDWTLPPQAKPYGRTPGARAVVRDCLAGGVARGEIAADVDIEDAVDLLLAAYAWAYRLAAWRRAGAAEMTAAMDRQVDLIVRGIAARP